MMPLLTVIVSESRRCRLVEGVWVVGTGNVRDNRFVSTFHGPHLRAAASGRQRRFP